MEAKTITKTQVTAVVLTLTPEDADTLRYLAFFAPIVQDAVVKVNSLSPKTQKIGPLLTRLRRVLPLDVLDEQ
jgi:hypothetical protein